MMGGTSDPAIARKIARLVSNPAPRPRVLDLFAGCGGLSLGFDAAEFEVVAAIESDDLAARSHALNFCRSESEEVVAHHAMPRDITQIDPEELVEDFGLGDTANAVDVIVGGPPCQAYARVGRAKLREVAAHPQAFKFDPRANLYLRYLAYIERLKPLALLMENVPDILNHGGHNIVEEMVETLGEMGYEARYSLINSAHHGVPQMRYRVFMIAFHKELGAAVRFPRAARSHRLPSGYRGTRAVALKLIDQQGCHGYVEPDLGDDELPPAITAGEALCDLPPITLHKEGKLKRGARRFTELMPYRNIPVDQLPAYARNMRTWTGFEGGDGVYDHVLRYLPRDTAIFEHMKQGDEYPAAHLVATQLFEKEAARQGFKRGGADWKQLYRKMVPPYPVHNFPNRWWKLRKHGPSRTVMAHISKDTYSHIHYDSTQGRVITVREAARLQSFPDGFVFAGTMNPAFRQIGNAVPPLMAQEIAEEMMTSLRDAIYSDESVVAAE